MKKPPRNGAANFKSDIQKSPSPLLNIDNLKKRAKSKTFTNAMVLHLVDLNSDLNKSYWNSYHCNRILMQTGNKITAKFCNTRWCATCNRVRTMKMIKGYGEVLKELESPFFVTLTVPNVSNMELAVMINLMFKELKRIQKVFEKRKTPIIGIRKLECTYNPGLRNFHPHFHLLISGEAVANELVFEWLKRFQRANRKGQDVRQADENSIHELFKYFTKVLTGKGEMQGIYTKAMDVIFNVMKGRRVFQPMGVRKQVSEDIEEIQSEEYEIEQTHGVYSWEDCDWIDSKTGKPLTGYIPSQKELDLLSKIR